MLIEGRFYGFIKYVEKFMRVDIQWRRWERLSIFTTRTTKDLFWLLNYSCYAHKKYLCCLITVKWIFPFFWTFFVCVVKHSKFLLERALNFVNRGNGICVQARCICLHCLLLIAPRKQVLLQQMQLYEDIYCAINT